MSDYESANQAMNESATDSTKRFEDSLSLSAVSKGDRIEPALIPRSPKIDVGERVARHIPKHNPPENEDERTYGVRLIAHGSDSYGDVQTALVYDPEADLFARLGGHTNSGAWNQKERDWKVRDVGRNIEIVDQWDVEIPDLEEFGESEEEFVSEWAELLFDNIRYGDEPGDELEGFDGKKFRLRDYDGRTARVQYELVSEEDDR